jgi:hypothetical protein
MQPDIQQSSMVGSLSQLTEHNETTTTAFGIPTLEDTKVATSQEFNNLSPRERPEVDEDPEIVDRKLLEFDLDVSRHKNKAYEIAESLSKGYVENCDFRLMFLRAEGFNVQAATHRLMNFFEQKLVYFGESKLTKDIQLSDLSEDELAFLDSGIMQEHGETDTSGRAVVSFFQQLLNFKTPENMVCLLSWKINLAEIFSSYFFSCVQCSIFS